MRSESVVDLLLVASVQVPYSIHLIYWLGENPSSLEQRWHMDMTFFRRSRLPYFVSQKQTMSVDPVAFLLENVDHNQPVYPDLPGNPE